MAIFVDAKVFEERFSQAVTARAAGMVSIDCYFLSLDAEISRKALTAISDDKFLSTMASLSVKLTLLGDFSNLTQEEASAISDFFDEDHFARLKGADVPHIQDAILRAANLSAYAKGLYSKTFPEFVGLEGNSRIGKSLSRHGQEWRTHEPVIDDEHDSFNELVIRLLAVACNSSNPAIISGALETLKARMRLHADAEESFAGKADAETAEILREAHLDLFAEVDAIARSIGQVTKPDLLNLIAKVGAEIERHEEDVDVPLFRLLKSKA
ncbi:MAG TPA: hypothetical protein HPQ04_09970 [Rhodospirillaceae bacterium]|nr:hypothetical protein [Rhodospirillaceae bacterium]